MNSTPFKAEWVEEDRFWYEERSSLFIVHYDRSHPNVIEVFAGDYPLVEAVEAVMNRALITGGITFNPVKDCRFQSWSGGSTWWQAQVSLIL